MACRAWERGLFLPDPDREQNEACGATRDETLFQVLPAGESETNDETVSSQN